MTSKQKLRINCRVLGYALMDLGRSVVLIIYYALLVVYEWLRGG
nr:MAG TPA: hypothetical protein [Caudoviricetes sp.]